MLRRILIADREPAVADTLAAYLTLRGLEARTAYDAKQAMTEVRIWRPDIFLADPSMPGMDAVELAGAVRPYAPECRLLLAAEPSWAAEMRERAAWLEILEKPVDPETLLHRLAESAGLAA